MDVLLLQLRNAIADKEFIIACANHDTAKYEAWQCDWYSEMRRLHEKIETLLQLATQRNAAITDGEEE